MASSSNSAFASTSASTSTADGNNCNKYDVFLNHRGPDVKNTFVSHLYRHLNAHGLRVFMDREELRKGDELTPQIEGAIRDASVQIAIFSLNYCESEWCLKELLLMLESKKERGSTIIPVFYGVKPSELRWTRGDNGVYARALRIIEEKLECIKPCLGMLGWTRGEIGVYARALRILEEKKTVDGQTRQNKLRYQPETIREWREALHDVAGIIGFELEAYNGGDEGQLLEEVVEQVLKIVPKPPLYVSKYPTGLDDKVNEFKESVLLQQHENGEARVVGIVGLGGVGKTTLAKEFFNGERKNYRRSSFLSDVRENSSGGSLNSLQIILIKDLTQLDVKINDTNEGITRLKEYLSPSKSLIIIDDVDHTDQLDALVSPAKDVLGSNSLIVVTSREKGVLKSWGIDDSFIYELKGLDPQHSNELFCWHAFHRPRPDAGFEEVVKGFVAACHGLPLSLKVIGALLRGEKNLKIWKEQLSKLSKILPEDIQNTLKISYDSLDKEDRLIFLDTACFFIGKEKDRAIRIWDESGWHGSLGLQNLQNKCLVEVKVGSVWDEFGSRIDAECIRMHDHVRDLGRSLADEEPSRRRIWRVSKTLSDQSPVRGVKTSAECDRLVTELRTKLPDFKGSCVESVFSVEQAPQLILLNWYNCPYSSLDSKISTENLRILHIEGGNLEKLWESQAPLQLRELYIEEPRLSKIPESIGQLKRLEKIVLRDSDGWTGLPSLETLPDEFCQLASLKHLELTYCPYLRSLPDSFGHLTSLQHINLSTNLQMLPNSFGNLSNLKVLILACSCLETLPTSFGDLRSLEDLELESCPLKCFPDSTRMLTQLKKLRISYIKNLERLEIKECPSREVGGEIETATDSRGRGVVSKLDASEASYSNAVFPNLQHLEIINCDRLVEVGALPTTLQTLNIEWCKELEALPSMETLVSLEELKTMECPKLKRIHGLGPLTKLKELKKLTSEELHFRAMKELDEMSNTNGRGTVIWRLPYREYVSYGAADKA